MNPTFLKQIQLEKDICKTQAALYQRAAVDGCDMRIFSERYLNSSFCLKSMEVPYSPFQREDAETCLELIYPQIGYPETMPFPSETEMFNPDVAWWVGYTYQQLYYETGIRGPVLAQKVPFNDLILNYPAHHTLEETVSTDKLCDIYGLQKDWLHFIYNKEIKDVSPL